MASHQDVQQHDLQWFIQDRFVWTMVTYHGQSRSEATEAFHGLMRDLPDSHKDRTMRTVLFGVATTSTSQATTPQQDERPVETPSSSPEITEVPQSPAPEIDDTQSPAPVGDDVAYGYTGGDGYIQWGRLQVEFKMMFCLLFTHPLYS